MLRIHFCAEPSCRWHDYAWTVEDAELYDRQWFDRGPQRVKRDGQWYCVEHGRLRRAHVKRTAAKS